MRSANISPLTRNAQSGKIVHVANVHKQAALRLLRDVKRETNCRVAGRNGSWPRQSLINSVLWAPLITAACHRHAPLPQRAEEHAPDLWAATGWPHITHTYGHTHADLRIHWLSNGSQSLQENKNWILFFCPLCVFVIRRKPETAYYSTKIYISIILNRSSILPPSHTYTQTRSVHSFVSCISVIDAMTGNKQAI